MRQVFDDGTFIDTDASGNVVQYSDTAGRVFEPDRSILQSFAQSVLGTLSTALNQRLVKPAAVPAGQVAALNLAGLVPILVLGGGAFLLFKALK